MNTLTIPPSPNWYENSTISCTADNTILYGARSDIVIIHPNSLDKPAHIDIIPNAGAGNVKCVLPNPNWNNPDKLALSLCENNILRLWNVNGLNIIQSQNAHSANSDKVVGATFAGNEKIVSVTEGGFIVIWRHSTNEVKGINDLLGYKVHVSCISSCMHAPWITAFGLKTGLIVVADLRRSGKILYKLRGHHKQITSLQWCPAAVNIFKLNTSVTDENQKEAIEEQESSTPTVPEQENDIAIKPTVKEKTNPWVNLKHADDDEIVEEVQQPPEKPEVNDFLSECQALKDIILSVDNTETEEPNDEISCTLSDNITEINDECSNIDDKITHLVEEMQISEQKENMETEKNNSSKETSDVKDYLLASSAIGDNRIYIWRAGSDGRLQKQLTLPKKSNAKNSRLHERTWIALCWVKPNLLLSSSTQAELMKWNLGNDIKNDKAKIVHNNHYINLFSICAPINKLLDFNATDDENEQLYVWTAGQERYLLNTGIGEDIKTIIAYPSLGSQVTSIVASPLDPSNLAVGFRDGTIKLWNLTSDHLQHIIMQKLNQKVYGKINYLEFHPTKENILAYGTNEGRVGLVSIINNHKQSCLFTHYFHSNIYKLEWGPLNGQLENLGLYVCAEGKIVVYDTSNPIKDPLHIENKESVTDIAWKPNYSIFAAATKVGSISLYSQDLKLLTTLYLQEKSISKFLWHPEVTAENSTSSEYSNCLALYTNESCVYVYDIAEDASSETGYKANVVATLKSESSLLKSLNWSPHQEGMIVFAGDDGTAEVWNIKTNTHLCSYVNPNFSAILTMVWSPLNKNFIIISNKDHTIRIWNIEENPPKDKSEISKERKNYIKSKGIKESDTKPDNSTDCDTEKTSKKTKWTTLLNSTHKMQNSSNSVTAIRYLMNDKKEEEDKNFGFLKLFGDKEDVIDLLNIEQQNYQEKKNYTNKQHLALWKGDLNETIKEAIEKELVTPWLINMASMISPKLWQTACETYAKKLSEKEDSNPFEIASYYLACHKVEEAIEVLCVAHLYKDALVIAKCRLAPSDPIINDILLKWANYCAYNGSFDVAAQCYVALRKYEDVGKVLFKKKDLSSIELALDSAKHCDNKELQNAILEKYNNLKQENDLNEPDLKVLPSRSELILNDFNKDITNDFNNDITNDLQEKIVSDTSQNDVE